MVEPNRLRTEARPNTLGAASTGVSPGRNVLTPPATRVADAAAAQRGVWAPPAVAATSQPAAGPRRRTWRRGFVLSLLAAAFGVVLIFTDRLALIEIGLALILGGLGFAIVSSLLDSAAREAAAGASFRALVVRTAFLPHVVFAWVAAIGMIALAVLFFVTAIDGP